jgi:RTX calcium-binding nonapeptide repeat (4 copies)
MATTLEYAALAAYVYNDQRGGAQGGTLNRLSLPTGWKSLAELGFPAGDNLNTNPFSFTGGAYLNTTTGEIVVAYKGTDFLVELSGRAWNTVADLVADASLAIARKGLGTYNLQQLAASSYFLAVKDWAVQNGYNGNNISFTGHSLGGGLASNMAVWFGRPATTFAEAPFEISAVNPTAIVAAAATLTLQAGVTASAAALAEITNLSALATTPGTFVSRESAVTNISNKGEMLEYLRALLPTVVGADTAIDIGSQTVTNALALHSMNLHAAFLFDDRLRALVKSTPKLIDSLLDKTLFAFDPNSTQKDLITLLVNDHIRTGFASNSALTRFVTDIDKLKGDTGAATNEVMRKALNAVVMEYHYNADPATSTPFLKAESGAVHFDLSRITTDTLKSLPLLTKAASSTLLGGDPFNSALSKTATGWHIQTGAGSMNWQASVDASDVAIGGSQDDILRAGADADYLVGAGGDDVLEGGTGNDTLVGGQDTDTYTFTGAFGSDTVIDSDGLGSIIIGNSPALTGGKKQDGTDNAWLSDDQSTVYTLQGADLIILARSTGTDAASGAITIKNWQPGQLGITLAGAATPAPPPEPSTTFIGDQRAKLIGTETQLDVTTGQSAYNTYAWSEVSWAQDGTLTITGALQGSMASIDGKSIEDWLQANLGECATASTNAINQTLYGGYGNDKLTALHSSATLKGGAGDDVLVGSAGADTLMGGAGNNTASGGAGVDSYVLGYKTDTVKAIEDGQQASIIQLDDSGVALQSLVATRQGADLVVGIRGTSSSVTITDYASALPGVWTARDAAGNSMTAHGLLRKKDKTNAMYSVAICVHCVRARGKDCQIKQGQNAQKLAKPPRCRSRCERRAQVCSGVIQQLQCELGSAQRARRATWAA